MQDLTILCNAVHVPSSSIRAFLPGVKRAATIIAGDATNERNHADCGVNANMEATSDLSILDFLHAPRRGRCPHRRAPTGQHSVEWEHGSRPGSQPALGSDADGSSDSEGLPI